MKFFNWLPKEPKINLNKHRQAIDKIDLQIIELLGYRFHHIKQIFQIKQMHNLPIRDMDREQQVQKNIELLLHLHNLPVEDEIKNIFQSIVEQSTKYQNKRLQPKKNRP